MYCMQLLQMIWPSLTSFAPPQSQSAHGRGDRTPAWPTSAWGGLPKTDSSKSQPQGWLSSKAVPSQKPMTASQPDLKLVMIEGGLAAKAVLLQVLHVPIVNIDIIKDQPLAWLLGLTSPHLQSSTSAT